MYQPKMFPSINYDNKFMEFFNAYPKRSGTMKKSQAYKVWQEALKAGVEPNDIIEGAKRYKAYCEKENMIGTNYVLQPVNFICELEYENDFLTEQEAQETEWQKACRMANEYGLEKFKGHPYETKEQFIQRVRAAENKVVSIR